MGWTPVENDTADDAGMGFSDEKGGARCHRFRINSDRISVERKGSGRRFIEHEEKGGSEALILVPLRMGGQMSPMGGPVANQFIVLCRGRCREMGDPGIDPPDRIRNIGTIDRDFMADEEIFGDILLNPFPELIPPPRWSTVDPIPSRPEEGIPLGYPPKRLQKEERSEER